MNELTDNTKTLDNAMARIEALEAENRHLLKVIRDRKIAGHINDLGYFAKAPHLFRQWTPVYYISDEYDAAGFLITPEVKIEQ